jgi:Ankyrin repeats (3 copies)
MNQPPSGDGDDDMERRFQTGLQDDSGPSEAVRRAILDHASRMAVEHAQSRPGGRRPAMPTARRRNTIFGALAAAVFAGLLVVPILRAPVVHRQSPVAAPPNRESAAQPAPAPQPQPAQAPQPQPAQAPRLAELQRNNTTYSGAGAQRRITADPDKPKEAAGPASSSSGYSSQAKSEPQAVLGAAPSPAAPADARGSASDVASAIAAAPAPPSRQLARATTSAVERGESLRGAAAAGNLPAVNAVLSSSFDVDARDRSGRTALMLAILNGHADVVDALLAHGAGVNAVDPSGVRPLQMARAKGNEEIIDSLLRAGAH